MALFKKPDQDLEFEIPDIGQAFLGGDPAREFVYTRTPEGVRSVSLKALGEQLQGAPQRPGQFADELIALGRGQFEKQSGISLGGLATFNLGDIRTAGLSIPTLTTRFGSQQDISPFRGLTRQVGAGGIAVPTDPNLQALIKTGGAGLGGFRAGGQAGIQAGRALSETPEALQNRITALQADLAQLTPPPPATGTAITGQALTPVPKPQLVTPSSTLISPASSVPAGTLSADTAFEPTKQETEISDLIKKITEGSTGLVGQTAFTAEQQKERGMEGLLKTQADLNAKLQLLKANEANIPLQIQQQSVGGGITTAIANRLTDAALRENAISANIIGAQLAGIQGQISTANALIENAVKMKFGQKEEEQKAKIDTLNLLLKDPALSLADKKRANIQLQIQEAKKTQTKRDESNYEDTQKEILKYPQAGSAVRDEMSKETTPVGVQNVAQKYGLSAAEKKAPGRAPGGTLTINEAKSLGLPLILVGKSEQEVLNDLQSSTPVPWFRSLIENQLQQTVLPEELQRQWEEFRTKILQEITSGGGTTGGELSNPFE